MKTKYIIQVLLMFVFISKMEVNAQDIEETNISKLEIVVNWLREADQEKAEDAIIKVNQIINICPDIDAYVKKFAGFKDEIQKKITDKTGQRKEIDVSKPQMKISGVVESKEQGYSIINANGSYYAIKADLNVGSTFSGNIIRSGGAITYKPLGGNSYNVQTFTQGSGISPQEKYSKLSDELKNYNKEYVQQWAEFKANCIKSLSTEIQNNKTILVEKHYLNGEKFLINKEYENAYKEFTFVQNLDKDYKDITQKLDLSNNRNDRVKKSLVYDIVSPIRHQLIIGTSNGLYQSMNDGKTWKLLAFDQKKITKVDAVNDMIVVVVDGSGIQFSNDKGKNWQNLIVKYSAAYNPVWHNGEMKYTKKMEILQPNFSIKNIKFVWFNQSYYLIMVEYIGKEGVYNQGNQSLNIRKDFIKGNYDFKLGNEFIVIPELCLSPNYGNNWVAFWGGLIKNNYYADSWHQDLTKWMNDAEDYIEEPEDAIDLVKENIAENNKVDEDQVIISSYSFIEKIDKEDNDVVFIATNYGLYKTCWDCENITKIPIPSKYYSPYCVYYNKLTPNIIIIGLPSQGLLISEDGGITWEEI